MSLTDPLRVHRKSYIRTVHTYIRTYTGDFFVGGGTYFIAGETMWLIHHSEGKGVGGECAPFHAAHSAET